MSSPEESLIFARALQNFDVKSLEFLQRYLKKEFPFFEVSRDEIYLHDDGSHAVTFRFTSPSREILDRFELSIRVLPSSDVVTARVSFDFFRDSIPHDAHARVSRFLRDTFSKDRLLWVVCSPPRLSEEWAVRGRRLVRQHVLHCDAEIRSSPADVIEDVREFLRSASFFLSVR